MPECIFCGFAFYSGWFLLFCHKNKSTNVRWPSLSHRADANFREFLYGEVRILGILRSSPVGCSGKAGTQGALRFPDFQEHHPDDAPQVRTAALLPALLPA